MLRKTSLVIALAVGVTACSDPGTAPENQLSDDDIDFLAQEIDLVASGVLDVVFALGGFVGAAGVEAQTTEPRTTTWSYERTRSCSAGGSVTVAGSGSRVVDREAGTVDVESSGSKTHSACARTRGDKTITLDGSAEFSHERHWLNRQPTGTWSTSISGSFDWSKSTGESGSCTYELNASIDTATNTKSVTGSFCGRDIDRSRTWRDS